jgi:hypothetical protein
LHNFKLATILDCSSNFIRDTATLKISIHGLDGQRGVRIMDEKNIEALEAFLSQSLVGVHHLFEHRAIAEILKSPTQEGEFFSFENLGKIQNLMDDLLKRKTLEAKKEYLGTLDPKSYEILLRTYFHILENTVATSRSLKH